MVITTRLGEMDDSRLQKREDVVENDDYRMVAVEYCLLACEGVAHQTGVAQGDGCFCEHHVHRSGDLTVKRWPEGMGALAASF